MNQGSPILICFPPLLVESLTLIPTLVSIQMFLHPLSFPFLRHLKCLIQLLFPLFLLVFLLYQLSLLEPLRVLYQPCFSTSIVSSSVQPVIQSLLPLLHPLQNLFLYQIIYMSILILCMQTRSKSGIHNPRLHPSLFLTHSEP